MKKFLAVLCLFLCSTTAMAQNVFPYKGTALNDLSNNVRIKGGTEYVSIPSKQPFNVAKTFLGLTAAAAVITPALLFDPYVVQIDGQNYVLVKDRCDLNWSEKDLLGIDDPKENRFQSLLSLNSDGDYSKLSPDELKKAGIRFVRMDKNGTLLVNDRKKDYDLNKIDYIDIINLKRTANSDTTGIFGHFTVYLKTTSAKKKAVVGYVTFETNEKIQVLFK